ncbi:MAG: lipase family protein, partial [Planctomycetota bacterium]
PACEKLLFKLAHEPPPTEAPVHLGPSRMKLRILVVPGLLGDAIAPWVMPYAHALRKLGDFGYESRYLSVSGRAGTKYNANLLKEAFAELEFAPDEKVLLIGYSKGVPDALEATVAHPEVRDKVDAILSVVGAVGGSPVADEATGILRGLFKGMPLVHGTKGDKLAIESLERRSRQLWLNENRLPESIRYFSLCAFTDRDNVSAVLRSGYDTCSEIDARNDSQIIFYDQIIPGSTLLGFANGDHWAVCLPFNRNMSVTAALFVTRNEYPRDIILEAAVRYIEEQLLSDAAAQEPAE